ncbi:sporulation protein YpjB [Oceanobacillus sp. FSL K6-2867]|uniref:sporulation protein YpjB n=1 Tax=Oceanobacillus sp. FSL K6-2867 TaxID=2954748 RepID=UPI0030D6D496
MVNRLKLIVRITAAVLIGIGLNIYFGVAWIEASVGNNEHIVEKQSGITPLIWAAIIIGGCITLTLSYVSWRKYRAEVKAKEARNKDKLVD